MGPLRFNLAEEARIERGFERTRRAWELLDLITAEFKTDPQSVQCFDARIVNEAIQLVETQKREARWSEPLHEEAEHQ